MKEISITATFKPEEIGISVPTYTIVSGEHLRTLHVSKQYAAKTVDWEDKKIDPACVTKKEMEELISLWTKEAESLYPGEGDYRVRLLNEIGDRIPIGSEVEFIVEENQIEASNCEEALSIQ
jgi:hypothetical protein